jgi:hypothetical protein
MRPDYPIPRIKGKALSASTSAGRMHRSEQANSVTNLVAKLFSAVPLISGMAKLTTSRLSPSAIETPGRLEIPDQEMKT